MTASSDIFVSTAWLSDHLKDPDLRIVDATWHLPELKRDPRKEFAEAHIPGAHYFDIDEIADPNHELGHMLPSAELFAQKVAALGISSRHRVIAYDTRGLYSAARVWWMFRTFGHDAVSVLDGGLPKWIAEGRACEAGEPPTLPTETFSASLNNGLVSDAQQVLKNIASETVQIVDARTPGRFSGTERDPYEGVRAGRIPGSTNVYWATLLDPQTKTLLSPDELKRKFSAAGVDLNKPIIFSCGSGVTACIVASAAQTLGASNWSVYDGSWDEWGRSKTLPIES